jgi:hypothetical protein
MSQVRGPLSVVLRSQSHSLLAPCCLCLHTPAQPTTAQAYTDLSFGKPASDPINWDGKIKR